MPNAEQVTPRKAGAHADPRSSAEHRPTSDELTKQNIRTIVELELAVRSANSFGQRLAAWVAAFCGSMTFVWIHVGWFAAWIILNTSPLLSRHPDPFPFTFLAVIVSLEAIFLSAFILNSQSQENRLTERRSHLDLQINLLTEQENTKMLKMLRSIADKVGADIDNDPDLAVLEESTRPEKLIEQIEEATARDDKRRRAEE